MVKKKAVPEWYAAQCWRQWCDYLGPWTASSDSPENELRDHANYADGRPFDLADLDVSKVRMASLLGINRSTLYGALGKGDPELRLTKAGKITVAAALLWQVERTTPGARERRGKDYHEDAELTRAEIQYEKYLAHVLAQTKYLKGGSHE